MEKFRFQTPPIILAERGGAGNLGKLLRQEFPDLRRVCVVTDTALRASGLLTPAFSDLEKHDWKVTVIDDVIADPPDHIVRAAAAKAGAAQVELVLGIGGGSSMDVAKLVAVLVPGQKELGEIYGIGKVKGTRLPLVQVPTTAGTGSEVTGVSVVTTGATTKTGVLAPQLFADMVVLDPLLTLSLPAPATAATGIDAMVHAIEAYTSKDLKNPISDMLALQALRLLTVNLLTACQNGQDLQAREALLLGAMYAGQAFANAPVAAVHALAYPIGGIFHVPHGLSNALVLLPVMRFNAEVAHALYAEIAQSVVPGCQGDTHAQTRALIDWLDAMIDASGIPRTLREVGIQHEDLDRLADAAMLQTRLLGNNPRALTREDAYGIYASVF